MSKKKRKPAAGQQSTADTISGAAPDPQHTGETSSSAPALQHIPPTAAPAAEPQDSRDSTEPTKSSKNTLLDGMQEVKSSNLAAVGFFTNEGLPATEHTVGGKLRVLFRNGSVWEYGAITRLRFDELINAASVGSFFNSEIKLKPSLHPARKVLDYVPAETKDQKAAD